MPLEMVDPNPSEIADVTCTACGCLCDDIVARVAAGRVVAAERACTIGREWYLADHGLGGRPAATIEGEPVTLDAAVARAAEILGAARSPLILGLSRTSMEAQAEAVAIADAIGATIDPAHSASAMPRLRAVQGVGWVSATLGEVKDRADVVVFWGVDPVATHPRHFERYSVEPRGRFVPGGRRGRTVIVVDAAPSATSAQADHFFEIAAESWGESLNLLRAMARGIDLASPDPRLRTLVERLKAAHYGAFFFGPSLGQSRGGSAAVEAALTLVRDLNTSTRFVAMTLGGPGNPGGAEAVLTWQAGSPLAVDFSLGYPRHLPDEATAMLQLARGEADAALIVADDPATFLTADALDHLARIPTVVLGPDATGRARTATVAIASATYGIHSGGTVMRSDGVTLPLRPSLATDLPTDRDLLAAILRQCDQHGPRRA